MLAYDRQGEGPPLLLVHGLGSCKEMWRPLLPALAREREVIAVDLPGFGASPPGPDTVEGLAEALSELAAGLGLERPHVAGNSLGGGVALTMGAAGTARTVCALSPIGFVAGREKAYGRAVLAGTRGMAVVLAPVAAEARPQRRPAHAALPARGRAAVAHPARGRRALAADVRAGARVLGPAARRSTTGALRCRPARPPSPGASATAC